MGVGWLPVGRKGTCVTSWAFRYQMHRVMRPLHVWKKNCNKKKEMKERKLRRRLGLDRFGRVADKVDGAPVAERHSGRNAHDAHAERRVMTAWAAFTIGFLQLPVVAEEGGDQYWDDDAPGQKDKQGWKAWSREANAVDDLFPHFALEDGDAWCGITVTGIQSV